MEVEDEDSPDPRSYFRAPVSRRILVTVAGAVMNLILGFAVLVAVVCMQDAVLSRTVGDFYPDASTQQHGLQVGDTILAVNGRRCFIANDVSYEFARTQQNTADLTVQRDGKKVELKNVVFDTRTDEDGNTYMAVSYTHLDVYKRQWPAPWPGSWAARFQRAACPAEKGRSSFCGCRCCSMGRAAKRGRCSANWSCIPSRRRVTTRASARAACAARWRSSPSGRSPLTKRKVFPRLWENKMKKRG